MRVKPFLVLTAAGVVAALALGIGAATSGTARCRPGPTKVGGKKATRFCGPATAALHVGHNWFRLTGGSCAATSEFFTINIGTVVFAPNQKVPYFGLSLGKYPRGPKNAKPAGKDGVYIRGVLVIRWHGGAWDITGYVRITLKHDRSAGVFAGRTSFYPHRKVSGAFSC